MECNKEEAFRAKEIAERRFAAKDFIGAKKYAVRAQTLYPELEGISQMLATFDVYVASAVQIGDEIDFYSVLGLKPLADEDAVRKQYRKLALILHPDKNKTIGADGAFKLVSEAWTLLSDNGTRTSYDLKRRKQSSTKVDQTNLSSFQKPGVNGYNCSKSSISQNQPKQCTFWTICSSCKVQYEYLRKYLNNRLSCKNCRKTFVAVETGTAPVNGSVPYCSWSFLPENGHGRLGYNGATYFPANTILFTGNGVSGFHSGYGSDYSPNMSFQCSPFPGASYGVVGAHGSTTSASVFHQPNREVKTAREKMKSAANENDMKTALGNMTSNMFSGSSKPSVTKANRPEKKRKVTEEGSSRNAYEEMGSKTATSEARMTNGDRNAGPNPKPANPSNGPTKCFSVAPAFDARKLLIDKARTEIRKKLEEMKLAAAVAAAAEVKAQTEVDKSRELPKIADLGDSVDQSEQNKPGSISITVPDSDFHDFDEDRSERCFKPKQIWALYDEEDGMPRLYCLIRQVISLKPFKIHISHLNSKTDSEFSSMNWVVSKSCGNFRAGNSDVVDQVNIFSHVLCGQKAGRGGCIQIFPKRGHIWAVYQNWSPDWRRNIPGEVRYQYEMVEVLDDYTEELGVCVSPLVKLDGFKTVYQRNMDKNVIRWIPRKEMLCFSHQVPSWLLKGEDCNLPDGCWDLDPAATPEELLQAVTEERTEN
ncbi:hypothetical protein HHK36_005782 [Tetracentron sinense]|uniref:J domain-containing protein n=1 Tax=Tetracentron sinense TaxID=13715 RepID=A0A834ZQZ4_TETSI|nr:hypothetical protein HHK36_005782 [Tetracentron sinense]